MHIEPVLAGIDEHRWTQRRCQTIASCLAILRDPAYRSAEAAYTCIVVKLLRRLILESSAAIESQDVCCRPKTATLA